jgi:hypothetical protein
VVIKEPLEEGEYTKTPVFDGPTYLYTKHRLRISGIYNPFAVSYLAPVGFAPPVATTGQKAPQTDAAIRHQLAQPQQALTYAVGNSGVAGGTFALLSSTGVDAANGPFPTVETYINEAALYVTKPTVLLSQRWKMSHHINPDALCTRRITGHAAFRSDRLLSLVAKPDDYRGFCFHPIPTTFKRISIDAEVDEDNLAFDYTIVDQEQMLSITVPGLSRIEGHYTQRQTAPGTEQQAWQSIQTTSNILGKAFELVGLGNKTKIADVKGGIDTLVAEGGNAIKFIPRRYHDLSITCYGPHGSTWTSLETIARSVISKRITTFQFGTGTSNFTVNHQYSMSEMAVTVSCTLESGPAASAFLAGGLNAFGGGLVSSFPVFSFGPPDELAGVATIGQSAVTQVLAPDNARGTYLGSIVAAALQAPNATPPQPTNPPQFTTRTPP